MDDAGVGYINLYYLARSLADLFSCRACVFDQGIEFFTSSMSQRLMASLRETIRFCRIEAASGNIQFFLMLPDR
ncbi:hypothetical protein, partial [Serratia symbiotica]|uniref:hypothetical protein n=1 Tax=Serratia symbiotica TaxID=138074 RepID=UPI0005635126